MTHVTIGALLIAFAGGLVSFFSPCVAPLAPGYISYVTSLANRQGTIDGEGQSQLAMVSGQSAQTVALPMTLRTRLTGPAATGSLLFVAGFSAAFVALGLVLGEFSVLLAAYRPVMETIAGIIMLAMGAFLLGLLPQQVTFTLMREARLRVSQRAARRWGLAAPFALGVVFAAGWTPCIGPVLASILAYVGASGDAGQGTLLLAVYSLGFALPFLAIGLGWSASLRALGWAKRYSGVISKGSGVVLILVSLLYLTGEVSVISAWAQHFAVL
ncbi:MAG TPA: cytochrome c biogenesis protein CcdA [Ktedonobacterales bacterium]|nr:cytochrome c biogenesis protein CcdA [Ktedonobacterales bacterium]HUY79452.1 cytochrome c biogenesis protein CcdA [Ktedonobacterales bacterium]